MYDEYKAYGFNALSINLWQDWSIVRYYATLYSFSAYRDAGAAWNLYNISNGIPLNYVIDSDGIVRYASTGFNESAIRSIIESYLTGIAEQTIEFKPISSVSVAPNPANKNTSIRFGLQKSENVSVRVYSSSGKLVKTLFTGKLDAGTNSFNWNLHDNTGHSVANGIYLYEIITETSSVRTKVSVLR